MDVFKDLDPIVKILSLGISGLCFLLMIMAFRLIWEEQKRDQPRPLILKATYIFMVINMLNVIVVGVLGLPAISRNVDLNNEKKLVLQELGTKTSEFNFFQKANDFQQSLDSINIENVSLDNTDLLDAYVQSLDSLKNEYAAQESPKADSIQMIKVLFNQQALTIKSDTSSSAAKVQALERLTFTNQSLKQLLKHK